MRPSDNNTGPQGGLGVKRSCALWLSDGLMLLQLDPLDHLLTLRVRRRPSGPAPVGPQGRRVGCFALLFTFDPTPRLVTRFVIAEKHVLPYPWAAHFVFRHFRSFRSEERRVGKE